MDPEYLWNPESGIYVDGSAFDGSRESRNSCQPEWERRMHLEFFETDGTLQFSTDAGVEVKGRMNCEFPRKPLGVFFKSKYGEGSLKYRLFDDKAVTTFSSFLLSPGGADGMGNCYKGTMIRDGLVSRLVEGEFDVDYEAYRPAVLYLNGNYWGIHHIRERNKADYLAGNHGIDPNQVDILENEQNGGVIRGDNLHYQSLLGVITTENVNDPSVYKRIEGMMDIDEFINYQITEIYINNEDWGRNNVLCWRPRTADGRWRWVLFDVEGGFGLYGANDVMNNLFNYDEDDFLRHHTLFSGLMKSVWFRNEFLQRFATLLNTTFSPERVVSIVDEVQAELAPEMERDIQRWKDATTQGGSGCRPIASFEQWETHVEIIRDFARFRPEYLLKQMVWKFHLAGTFHLEIEAKGGSVLVNGAEAGTGGTWFSGVPMRFEAVAEPGFRFEGWTGIDGGRETEAVFTTDATVMARFVPSGESLLPDTVSNLLVLTREASPYLSKGDLVILPGGVLRMEAGSGIRMQPGSSIYCEGSLQVSGEAGQPVEIGSLGGEDKRWGSLVIRDGEGHSFLQNLVIREATSDWKDPVSNKANLNIIRTYVPVDALSILDCLGDPVYVDSSQVWIRDSEFHSSGVCDFINVANSANILIENCLFSGNQSPDTDAIDLDAVEDAEVRNCTFTGFSGYNSDGIDTGYSAGVVIRNNRFHRISDKAVSVGAGSKVLVTGNLMTECASGVAVKDLGSEAVVDRNTFWNNTIGVSCFEKEAGRGGGRAIITHSIFAGGLQDAVVADAWSEIQVRWSLSDRGDLQGDTNLSGDPGFAFANEELFNLAGKSICIDAGNPFAEPDPDGTVPDLGYAFRHANLYDRLVINELRNDSLVPWIELYNGGDELIDLSQLFFSSGSLYEAPLEFLRLNPPSVKLGPGEFLLLMDWERLTGIVSDQGCLDLFQYLSGSYHLVSHLNYGKAEVGYSWGAYPDGSGSYRHFRVPTPGAPNHVIRQRTETIFINEFLASNETGIKDESGQYEDWIELYNAGDQAIDVGGLYLTDKLTDPTRHRIPDTDPSKTTIPARGFLLLWADGEPEQGVLHLDFRLDAEGEEIGLFEVIHPDTLMLDAVVFNALPSDVSMGRIPDGGPVWHSFILRTPGFSNLSTGVTPDPESHGFSVWPVPASDVLYIDVPGFTGEMIRIDLILADGRVLESRDFKTGWPGILQIGIEHVPQGIAFIRFRSERFTAVRRILIRR